MRQYSSFLRVEAPLENVWNFYTNPYNLERITLPRMRLRVVRADSPMRQGARILMSVHIGPFPMHWESLITDFEPMRRFTDSQVHGPFSRWTHTHEFEADGAAATQIRDIIHLELPLGLLGQAAGLSFMERELEALFAWREQAVRHILSQSNPNTNPDPAPNPPPRESSSSSSPPAAP